VMYIYTNIRYIHIQKLCTFSQISSGIDTALSLFVPISNIGPRCSYTLLVF